MAIVKAFNQNLFLWFSRIILDNVEVDGAGNVTGQVGATGGFVAAGSCLSPINAPTAGITPAEISVPISDFLVRVGTKLGKSPTDVLKAISASLEDVYKEQLPK